MAEQAQRHERTMALEARRQERLEQAYIELLRYLSHYADWAKSAQRLLGKPQAAPDPPPREELNRVEALVEVRPSALLSGQGVRRCQIERSRRQG